MTARTAYFVTGTDTEIGKTLVSAALLHALANSGVRAAGMKPVAAGAVLRNGTMRNDDVDMLAAAASVVVPVEMMAPYILREATAPHVAAQLEGVLLDIGHIQSCYDQVRQMADAVVVEGVGGFRVPLSARFDTADLAQRLKLPVILVVGLRLGCINHALLTADAIAARGLQLAGWVANLVDPQMPHAHASIEALKARLPAPLLGSIPRLPQAVPVAALQYLDFSRLPGWPSAGPNRSV